MTKTDHISFPAFFLIWAKTKGWQVPDLHLRVCDWLETRAGRVAVLEVFRGAAKSTIVAVYIAWRLRENPGYRYLVQSADDLTSSKMSADARHVISTHPLCQKMKGQLWQVERFNVKGNMDARNASVTAQGIMANVTSSRADEVIFDDVEVPKNIQTPMARMMLRMRISEATHILVPGGRKLFVGTPHTHDSIYDEEIAKGAEALIIPLIDEHGGCAWPERFTEEEVAFRRKECKTQNEWDSQYMLMARPLHDIRLDPERLVVYDDAPVVRQANGEVSMWLNNVRLVGASAYWDVALGRKGGDDSVFAVGFTDDSGNLYWQVADILTGGVDEQCEQIRRRVLDLSIPGVCVETNGPGGFVPAILRKHLHGVRCGVTEYHAKDNKVKRILDAFDAPLSGQFLHVHSSLMEGKLPKQMRDWIPENTEQPDDILDAGAGFINNTPVRIGRVVTSVPVVSFNDWRPSQGSNEVTVDLS